MGGAFGCSRGQRSPIMENYSDYDTIFRECRDKISTVDQSMTNLANSVDIMHAAARGLAEYRKEQSLQEEERDTVMIPSSKELHMNQQMLHFLERTVLCDKNCATGSVHDFLQFLIQIVGQFSETPSEKFQNLSLHDYLKNSQGTKDYLKHIEQFETEDVRLKENKKNLSVHIAVLVEKEKHFIKEVEVLNDKNKTLEDYKTQLETRIEEAEQNNAKLNAEIDTVRRKLHDIARKDNALRHLEGTNKNVQNKMEQLQNEMKDTNLENEMLNQTVSKQAISIESFKEELENKNNQTCQQMAEYEELRNENESLKLENEMITNAIKEKDSIMSSFKNLDMTVKNMNTEIDRLTNENTTLKEKYKAEKETSSKLTDDLNNNNKKIKNTELELEKLNDSYKGLEEQNKRYKHDLEMKTREEKIMVQKVQNNDKLWSENTKMKADIMQMTKELERLQYRNKSLQAKKEKENKMMEEKLQEGREKNDGLVSQVTDLTQEIERLNLEAERTRETVRTLTGRNEVLQEENERMNQELELFKRKTVIQVQLYYQLRGELICTIEEELTSLLKTKLESEYNCEVEFIKCVNAIDVQTDKPLLLLCISASRIGTDAANTIHGLHLTSKMSLLIFHHKDEHALPSQASCQILTGQEYKTLGGIFDFAFLSGRGIYTCPMNDGSIAKIVNFINTEGVALSTSTSSLSR